MFIDIIIVVKTGSWGCMEDVILTVYFELKLISFCSIFSLSFLPFAKLSYHKSKSSSNSSYGVSNTIFQPCLLKLYAELQAYP